MKGRYLVAVLAGGLAAFVWSSISWMVLPWHQPTLRGFEDEASFGLAVKKAAPAPGIYTYPAWTGDSEEMERKHMEGPYVFASVLPGGLGACMGRMMVCGFIVNVIGASILLLMMMQVPDQGWKSRMPMVMIGALFVSLVPALIYWNWWQFPLGFTVVGILAGLIAWTLSGFVMAKVTSRKG